MTDHATPNLPSRSFDETLRFYGRLGFRTVFRDEGWVILDRGRLKLEFFPHPELDPYGSWFSCCLRLDDLAGFYDICRAAGIAEADQGFPRLHPPGRDGWGSTMAALIDPTAAFCG